MSWDAHPCAGGGHVATTTTPDRCRGICRVCGKEKDLDSCGRVIDHEVDRTP